MCMTVRPLILGVLLLGGTAASAFAPAPFLGQKAPPRPMKDDFAELMQRQDGWIVDRWTGPQAVATVQGVHGKIRPLMTFVGLGKDFDPAKHVSKGFMRRGTILGFVYHGVSYGEGWSCITSTAFRLEEVRGRRYMVLDGGEDIEVRYEYEMTDGVLTLKGHRRFKTVADEMLDLSGTYRRTDQTRGWGK